MAREISADGTREVKSEHQILRCAQDFACGLGRPQSGSTRRTHAGQNPAYRAIAELNGGFDKVVQELHVLGQVSYFRPDRVTAMRYLICQIRAEANRDFTMAVHEREKVNAGLRERLSNVSTAGS
jgi:hypothetical protein